jgi:hypothetical protein
MSKKQGINGSELQGNAWVFASIGDARAVYQSALAKPGFISDQHDSSLDIGFFAKRSVLVFLWRPGMDPGLVASVEHLVVLGGGNALEENLKQELLRQARLRQARLRQARLRWRAAKEEGSSRDDDDAPSAGEHLDGFAGLTRGDQPIASQRKRHQARSGGHVLDRRC